MIQLELFPEFQGAIAPAHSKIGASSMSRWSKCPGSIRLCEGTPNIESRYAAEGTRAHELAAGILEDPSNLATLGPSPMLDAVMVYVDFVRKESEGHTLFIEKRFDLSSLHEGLFGTADAIIYREDTKHLIVADYKHGEGVPVEVENNSQLMYYGLGALLSLGLPCETVELVVVQPRCAHDRGPIRRWQIQSVELLSFSADLVEFAKRTQDPDAPLVPGEQCQFCPAKFFCPVSAPAPKWTPKPRDPKLDFQPVDSSTV